MVNRFVTFLFLFVFLLTLFVCPVFASDDIQSESGQFGLQFDDGNVIFFNRELSGIFVNKSDQYIDCDKFYIYVPLSLVPDHLNVYFSFPTFSGYSNIVTDSIDFGRYYGGSYHYEGSISVNNRQLIGTSSISGSSAILANYGQGFILHDGSLDGLSYQSDRYIRIGYIAHSNNTNTKIRFVNFFNDRLDQGLSGVLGNPTYSFSGTNDSHFVNYFSGSFETDPVYIQGQLKSQYYDGSSVKVFSGSLLNSTSGTGGYLRIPKLTISSANPSANSMKFHALASDITGSLTPSSSSQDTDLQGTYVSRDYAKTFIISANRSFDDSELIAAVNAASDRNHSDITNFYNRNHSDLQAISSQLGELVDHQDQVNQTGDDIGSTTSDSSISNTSSSLSSGSSSLSGVLSTASDISSVSGAAAPYISFIGAAMPIILNFGNGVLAWAVVGIIACSVFLWILKKVAE